MFDLGLSKSKISEVITIRIVEKAHNSRFTRVFVIRIIVVNFRVNLVFLAVVRLYGVKILELVLTDPFEFIFNFNRRKSRARL